jgi:hypothetical protein
MHQPVVRETNHHTVAKIGPLLAGELGCVLVGVNRANDNTCGISTDPYAVSYSCFLSIPIFHEGFSEASASGPPPIVFEKRSPMVMVAALRRP